MNTLDRPNSTRETFAVSEPALFPAFREAIPQKELIEGRYHLRFARTPEELDAVLKLRFEVFNLEIGEGLEIQRFMLEMAERKKALNKPCWQLRLGIHTGPLVAGVIGREKFAYDVWGDTLNTASRLESSGVAGRINISGATYDR